MKTFTKRYDIKASPAAVFAALTRAQEIETWSGGAARMSATAGEAFSLWGGSIHGVNREVSPGKIRQDWKENGWEEFSSVTINLAPIPGGTSVEPIHDGIPDKSLKSIKAGWDKYYMLPLAKHVEATTSDSPFFQPFMGRPGVTKAKMFGWDCLKVNGNVFATLTPKHLVLKLAAPDITRALAVAGSEYFEPNPGMPRMKEWVALPLSASAEVLGLAEAAHDLIAQLPPKAAKR